MRIIRLRAMDQHVSSSPVPSKRTFAASLHHLIIALHIRGDEDYLGPKTSPCILKQLHCVWSATPLFRVPQYHPLRLDVPVDKTRNRRPERLLLIRANPDEEPSWTLTKSS